jgi:hypothetical protein
VNITEQLNIAQPRHRFARARKVRSVHRFPQKKIENKISGTNFAAIHYSVCSVFQEFVYVSGQVRERVSLNVHNVSSSPLRDAQMSSVWIMILEIGNGTRLATIAA